MYRGRATRGATDVQTTRRAAGPPAGRRPLMRMLDVHYLTLIEPFASLVALPSTDGRAKRVENRTWAPNGFLTPTPDRPLHLLIHAGVGTKYAGRSVTDLARMHGVAPGDLRPGLAIC